VQCVEKGLDAMAAALPFKIENEPITSHLASPIKLHAHLGAIRDLPFQTRELNHRLSQVTGQHTKQNNKQPRSVAIPRGLVGNAWPERRSSLDRGSSR
jgi:hypothetical protein